MAYHRLFVHAPDSNFLKRNICGDCFFTTLVPIILGVGGPIYLWFLSRNCLGGINHREYYSIALISVVFWYVAAWSNFLEKRHRCLTCFKLVQQLSSIPLETVSSPILKTEDITKARVFIETLKHVVIMYGISDERVCRETGFQREAVIEAFKDLSYNEFPFLPIVKEKDEIVIRRDYGYGLIPKKPAREKIFEG